MALIKCIECGKDISDKAGSCPNCGCPVEIMNNINNTDNNEQKNTKVNTDSNKKKKVILAITVIIVAILVIILLPQNSKVPEGCTEKVWRNIETYIKCADEFVDSGEFDCPDEVTDLMFDVLHDMFDVDSTYLTDDYALAELCLNVETKRISYLAKQITLNEFEAELESLKRHMEYLKSN